MNKIILFSTGCPKCQILKQKLELANIDYEETDQVQELIEKNILSVPVLKVNDEYLDFMEAITWVNN